MAIFISTYEIATLTVAGFLTYCLICIGYNLFLHPLRNYPGPFLARITNLYGGFHSMFLRLPQVTQRDLRSSGVSGEHPRYRSLTVSRRTCLPIWPRQTRVFNSSKALQDIYNNERVTKSDVYLVTLATTGKICIFNALSRHTHRARRKLIGASVSERAMRSFEPTMSTQIDIFLRLLLEASQKGSYVNMSDYIRRLGADIVGFLAFGFALNSQTEDKYQFLADAITFGNGISNVKMQIPILRNSIISLITNLLTHTQLREFYKMLELMISTRLAKPKDAHPDLYAHVVDQLEETKDVRMSDVWAEAMFFFPAGGDTTATAISSVFFYLSRNPECYQKLAREIRSSFTSSEEIKGGPKISSCRYLRATIDEALRMSPPVSGTLWRKMYDDDDRKKPLIVDGHVIPPGTHVGVNFYSLHHNEDYFPDSYTFKPERWLEADIETRHRMNEAFAAFSIGPRGCAGKAMAYLEASLVVARTIWYFDFEKASGEAGRAGEGQPGASYGRHRKGEFQVYDIFSSTQTGPNLFFQPRSGSGWEKLKAGCPESL